MRQSLAAVAFASGILITGCTCGTGVESDGGDDGGIVDGGHDAGLDGGHDGGTDAGFDAGTDAGFDAGFDAGSDAGFDAGTDGGPDEENDSGCPHRVQSGTSSTTYQIDIAHTGSQPNDALTLPLCRRWSHDFGVTPGFPVVAGGRVFVVTHTTSSGYGVMLWALDQQTGNVVWGPIDLGGTYWWGAAAYDNGKVFAVNADAFLRAFDAATGTPLWGLQLPLQSSCDSAPTASNGMVYASAAGGGGTVYGIDASDGGVRWTASVANGDTCSPAVSATGVYVSYACDQAYAFTPATGGQLWHYSTGCSGGGGKNVALFQGHVYTRDSVADLELDALTGADAGTYQSMYIPAFSAPFGLALYTPGNHLKAFGVANGAPAWSLDAGISVYTAPIVIGPHAVVADANALYVVRLADGLVVSSYPLAGVLGPDEQNVSSPLAGFAAGDGMLFVPAGTSIVAF